MILRLDTPAYFTSFYTEKKNMLPNAQEVYVIFLMAASGHLLQDLDITQVRITCQKLLDLYILTILEQR